MTVLYGRVIHFFILRINLIRFIIACIFFYPICLIELSFYHLFNIPIGIVLPFTFSSIYPHNNNNILASNLQAYARVIPTIVITKKISISFLLNIVLYHSIVPSSRTRHPDSLVHSFSFIVCCFSFSIITFS